MHHNDHSQLSNSSILFTNLTGGDFLCPFEFFLNVFSEFTEFRDKCFGKKGYSNLKPLL